MAMSFLRGGKRFIVVTVGRDRANPGAEFALKQEEPA